MQSTCIQHAKCALAIGRLPVCAPALLKYFLALLRLNLEAVLSEAVNTACGSDRLSVLSPKCLSQPCVVITHDQWVAWGG